MFFYTQKELYQALEGLQLQTNDTVLLHSDLSTLGFFENVSPHQEQLNKLFEALKAFFLKGSLMTPSFSYSYARLNQAFHLEKSPSELDLFSEFFRQHPDTVRSLHPIFSFSALGKNKQWLTQEVGRSAFGYNTPFQRLIDINGKILFFGASPGKAMTLIHHIEQLVGVSYFYHKAFFTPVFKEKKQQQGPFFAFVRYLGKVQYRHQPFQEALEKAFILRKRPLGMGNLYCCEAKKVLELGAQLLNQEPSFFIEKPYFVTQ